MNALSSRFSRFCFGLIGAASLVLLFGQGVNAQTPATSPIQQPDGTLTNGVPYDWSMRHMVFSNAEKASAKGMSEKLSKVVNNPRYILQHKRQLLAQSSEAAGIAAAVAKSGGATNASPEAAKATGNASKTKSATTRDWTLPLGNGGVAQNMWPANFYSGDATGAGGPPPTGYCKDDFVVVGLNVVSSTLQANLVAIDDLYTGSGGACGTGTTPTVKWAYNTSTNPSGTITTSPTLSLDGTQVAFVESTGSNSSGQSIFHVLKWADASGTASVGAPTKPTAVSSTVGCTAPCMVSITYNGSFGDTYSAPFYDFNTDTAYVGDDSGTLWAITGVFFGTPTVSSTAPFGGGLQVSGTAGQITAPVFDYSSGNIFIGGQDGMLYAVSSTNPTPTVTSIPVGNGGAAGYLAAAPIVDGFDGTVLEFAADNAAGVGAATAATKAVAVQADTTTPLGNPQVAIIGEGNLGTTSTLTLAAGTFDNNYYNYSGAGANTGHFYEIGTAAGSQNPVLYQLSYSGVSAITINTAGTGGATNPTVTIAAPGGGGTTATASTSGGVFGITVTAPGTGYTSAPTVTFTGGGGSSASGATTNYSLATVGVTTGGSNYTAVPAVMISGSGTGNGSATVALGIDAVSNLTPGAYTSFPTVSFPGGSPSGTGLATLTVQSIGVNAGGAGFTSIPTLNFSGTHTVAATGTLSLGLDTISASGGTGYTSVPSITFTGGTQTGGGPGGAAATALLGLVTGNPVPGAVVSSGGSYASIPGSTCTGGTTSGACTPVVGLQTITLSNGGTGYTAVPTVGFTGGTSSTAATAAAALGVTTVAVATGGVGYTGVASVGFSTSGSTTAATATSSMGVNAVSITSAGSYTSFPSVTFSGTATGTPLVGVTGVGVTTGGSFTSAATVTFSPTGATASASYGVTSVAVTGAGTLYTAPATVSFAGAGGATATATMQLSAIAVTGTACYTNGAPPTVTITGGGATTEGTATAVLAGTSTGCSSGQRRISSFTINTRGTGYTSQPTVTLSLGTCDSSCPGGGTATLNVLSVAVTGAGSTMTFPTVSFNTPTGGTAATGTTTATIESVSVSVAGSYGAIPTVSAGGGSSLSVSTVDVVGVTINAAGSGYLAPPSVMFSAGTTTATGTATLKVVSVTVNTNGTGYTSVPSVTFSGGGGTTQATGSAALEVVSITVGTAGDYTVLPTAVTISASHGAAASITAVGVVGMAVTTAGTGYATGPVSVNFTGGGGTGGAVVTVPLTVVGGTITAVGSYTALPTLGVSGGGGSGVTVSGTYTVVSVAVTAGGTYSTFPGATTSGGGGTTQATLAVTGGVNGVTVSTAGTGYSVGPITVGFAATGTVTAATATADLKIVSAAVTAPGNYTSIPTASVPGGATLTATAGILAASVSSGGSGYTSDPSVTFTGGGGSGGTGSTTITVTGVALTYGGGGYSAAPTVTISCGGCGATATATINPGSVMTAGTVPNCGTNCTVSASTIAVSSPLDEMFTTGGVDRIYFGYGNTTVASAVVGQTVTNGTISAPSPAAYTVPDGIGGSSAIVLDSVTTIGQANSMYFVEQGEAPAIRSISAGSAAQCFVCNQTATVTTSTPITGVFQTNDSVTIAGVTCSTGTCKFNGTFTITVTGANTFTFTICTSLSCAAETINNTAGTASDANRESFNAVKLTQTGLN